MNQSLVERHRNRQALVITKSPRRVHFNAISHNFRLTLFSRRAVRPRENIRANSCRSNGQGDIRARIRNRHVPFVAGYVPIKFVEVFVKPQRIGNRILDHDRFRCVFRAGNVNLQLAIVPHAA